VRLVSIEGGKMLRKRLAELGLSAGDKVRVVQRHGHGPLILAIKEDTRMAIGRGMAEKILVNTVKNL
jgi:Fe2+ transport system protein FeoA